ncbi:hypothetical protein AAHE18_10G163700 [Arachis hypogaea]
MEQPILLCPVISHLCVYPFIFKSLLIIFAKVFFVLPLLYNTPFVTNSALTNFFLRSPKDHTQNTIPFTICTSKLEVIACCFLHSLHYSRKWLKCNCTVPNSIKKLFFCLTKIMLEFLHSFSGVLS